MTNLLRPAIILPSDMILENLTHLTLEKEFFKCQKTDFQQVQKFQKYRQIFDEKLRLFKRFSIKSTSSDVPTPGLLEFLFNEIGSKVSILFGYHLCAQTVNKALQYGLLNFQRALHDSMHLVRSCPKNLIYHKLCFIWQQYIEKRLKVAFIHNQFLY